jgi:type I site-specific restriction endonuclease
MTPMRTSSLKNTMEIPRTPRPSKENINPRSRSASPRKPLKELANGIQPADLVREDTEEFVEQSKRMFRNIQVENEKLRQRVEHLETAKHQVDHAKFESMDQLQADLERLAKENHRLETLLQESWAAATQTSSSPRPRTASDEISRLSDELAWHAKLHLYAEKERMRLMDLLEFAAREGKFVVNEYVGLKEKVSKFSLRSDGVDLESNSGWKCLV